MTRELRRLTFNLEREIIDFDTGLKVKATPLNVNPVVVPVDTRNILPYKFDKELHSAILLRGSLDSPELKAYVDRGVYVLPGPRGSPGLFLQDANAYVAGDQVRSEMEGWVWIPVQFYMID